MRYEALIRHYFDADDACDASEQADRLPFLDEHTEVLVVGPADLGAVDAITAVLDVEEGDKPSSLAAFDEDRGDPCPTCGTEVQRDEEGDMVHVLRDDVDGRAIALSVAHHALSHDTSSPFDQPSLDPRS